MATLGHVAVGLVAARLRNPREGTARLLAVMTALAALALLPDADFVAFHVGVPYAHPWGHRGATHAPAFAALVGLAVAAVQRARGRRALVDGLTAFAVVASHGLLDMLTTGGLGVEVLWPVRADRYFLPWRLIPVAPLGAGMLSRRGLRVLLTEALLFLPAFAFAAWPRPRTAPPDVPVA